MGDKPRVERYPNIAAKANIDIVFHSHFMPVILLINVGAFITINLYRCDTVSSGYRRLPRGTPSQARLWVKIPERSEDDFYPYRQARPCRWKAACHELRLRIQMTAFSVLSFPRSLPFGECERDIVIPVKYEHGVEGVSLLPFESFYQVCPAG